MCSVWAGNKDPSHGFLFESVAAVEEEQLEAMLAKSCQRIKLCHICFSLSHLLADSRLELAKELKEWVWT